MKEELRYTASGLSVEELADVVDDFWTKIQDPSSALSQEAVKKGVDVEQLRAIPREEAMRIEKTGDTLDPLVTTIIIAFLPVAVRITKDLWQKVLLPKITQEEGGGVLKPDKPDDSKE